MTTPDNDFKQKTSTVFSCIFCDYSTSRKCNYEMHLETMKHKNNAKTTISSKNKQKNYKKYCCDKCSYFFNDRSGLWRHKQKCNKILEPTNFEDDKQSETSETVENEGIFLDKEMFLMIVKQNQELMDLLKSGTNNYSNNHVNSHNKTFNLQVFLNETCKNAMNIDEFIDSIQPTLQDLENVGRVGYVEGISSIIINKLNTMEVSERPIHCSDLKREILYIKTEDIWNKETDDKPILLRAIKEVANKNMKNILEWQKKYPDCNKADSMKNDLFLKIVSNSMCGLTKEETNKNFNKIISKVSKKVSISDQKN